MSVKPNFNNLFKRRGKADDLQIGVDVASVTYAALKQVVEVGFDRQSWLLFASGIEHTEHIAEMLNNIFGISTVCIHSKMSEKQNDQALKDWKSGKARCAVNMNSLTTGVDHPACDLIGMLRPTMSTGLWVQMLGRGTRPYPGKVNCLVLDFAGNTRRLGPINDPVIPKLKGQGPPGDAPVRICEHCGTYNHASARVCIVCGEEFTFAEKLNRNASNLELLRSDLPQIEMFAVSRVVMVAHTSNKSGKDSIKVAYFCGLRTFYEYISVESNVPFFRKRSRDWFRQRFHYSYKPVTWEDDVPKTNAEVLAIAHELRQPVQIRVWVNKPTPEIMGAEF